MTLMHTDPWRASVPRPRRSLSLLRPLLLCAGAGFDEQLPQLPCRRYAKTAGAGSVLKRFTGRDIAFSGWLQGIGDAIEIDRVAIFQVNYHCGHKVRVIDEHHWLLER